MQNETQYLVDFKKWVCYNRLDARTMELFVFRVGQPILAGKEHDRTRKSYNRYIELRRKEEELCRL